MTGKGKKCIKLYGIMCSNVNSKQLNCTKDKIVYVCDI